ncbi:MAG: hypothetical protein AAF770_01150 [Bacteroidota bacterium]
MVAQAGDVVTVWLVLQHPNLDNIIEKNKQMGLSLKALDRVNNYSDLLSFASHIIDSNLARHNRLALGINIEG